MDSKQQLHIEYIPVAELMQKLHPANPKQHNIGLLISSFQDHGFVSPGTLDQRSGYFLCGHGRTEALSMMIRQKMPAPAGIVDNGNGWECPVVCGYHSKNDAQALAYLAMDNQSTIDGGWDEVALVSLLETVNASTDIALESTGFSGDELDDLLRDLGMMSPFVDKEAKPNPRNLPIDIIYTTDELYGAAAGIACKSGWKIGCRSTQLSGKSHTSIFQPERWRWRFDVQFVDNNYFNYEHQKHLEIVKLLKPKYCTVMDVMTKAQCKKDGIEWYSLEQILDWAEELSEHAENVIVIPKYDCLGEIPEKYILGYSVPTSHGGTPLPPEAFKGRRVHLLGGSWKAQLSHMAVLGDDVVSLDNNYILKQARFGSFTYPDGSNGHLTEDLEISPNNHLYVCMAISLGNIGAKINELYPKAVEVPAIDQNIGEPNAR